MPEQYLPKVYLYRRIVRAKLFIDARYADAINLDDIADEAYFSKYHFIRLFKKAYGKTPHQYLIKVRVDAAMLLLQKGLPVQEVCFAVGFDSVSSFSALFKKLLKQSPLMWQQSQQQRAAEMARTPLKFVPNCFAENYGWTLKRNFQ